MGLGEAFLAISLNTSLESIWLVPMGRRASCCPARVGAVIGVASIADFGRLNGASGAGNGIRRQESP